jgi:UDP-glucose 6-dehydrogenase
MLIGICGCGFVGNAIIKYFYKKQNYIIKIYDLYKNIGSFELILNTDILYLCLPTLYDAKINSYDMTEINRTLYLLNEHKYTGIILIKSTVLPTYCGEMNKLYPDLFIISNPEFLSAKTSVEDFENQSHIIIGYTPESEVKIDFIKKFYLENFPNANLSITDSTTSNLTKLACNSFYSVKIQYFTEIYLLCEKLNISYDEVRMLMIQNNWINPMHTTIPGHDNKISFGGACFPKDISALNEFMKLYDIPNNVIDSTIIEQKKMR